MAKQRMESPMKCVECGAMMKVRKENYRYEESGLKHVTLLAVDVARCQRCDNYEISIPHIEDLHRLIARTLIDKTTRFTGEEVRFLRKSLGWSGSDFAKHMGVAEETVSRWENDAAPIGPQADRLLRFLVAQGKLTSSYPTERLKTIDLRKATATKVKLATKKDHWTVEAA